MLEHEYDDAGVLVRSVETVDAEWDDEQRTVMRALAELEAQSCSGCGGWLPHTTSIDMDGGFVAEHPLRCHKCEAIAVRRAAVKDKPHPEALTVWPVHEKGR